MFISYYDAKQYPVTYEECNSKFATLGKIRIARPRIICASSEIPAIVLENRE